MKDMTLVGVDTGGTFTDIVAVQLVDGSASVRHCKVLSNPSDPSAPIVEGLARLGLEEHFLRIIHGTTVGTNAVLEGKGARVAYVTSTGFADVLSLGRQERENVYRLRQDEAPPPVPQDCCIEIPARISATGEALGATSDAELDRVKTRLRGLGVEAVAINLLFSFLQPQQEIRIAERLRRHWFVSCSSELLPEAREYERGMVTWLNASVGPVISRYLHRLQKRLPRSRVAVMQSSGTTIAAEQAAEQAVRLLLSGPAGGLAAARSIALQTGRDKLMTFDMGGTSTDVALYNGEIPLTGSARIGSWPLSIPSVDIHTIGAGGGSMARLDRAGMLLVGPESAGADPGPVCYAKGGTVATVTDANLVLGRIPADTLLGGYLPLDIAAARSAMAALGVGMGCDAVDAALGVVRIANEHMARALRVISVERGHDPAEHALLCFGGAGGLHACDLAELLGMHEVIIPARSGVLSAMGMLVSEPGRELSQAVLAPLEQMSDEDVGQKFRMLESRAADQLAEEGCKPGEVTFRHRLELRYQGQNATISVDWIAGEAHAEKFHREHEDMTGQRMPQAVELVNLRLGARAPAVLSSIDVHQQGIEAGDAVQQSMPGVSAPVPVRQQQSLASGERLQGPCILVASVATTWVKPGWAVQADTWGNLILQRSG